MAGVGHDHVRIRQPIVGAFRAFVQSRPAPIKVFQLVAQTGKYPHSKPLRPPAEEIKDRPLYSSVRHPDRRSCRVLRRRAPDRSFIRCLRGPSQLQPLLSRLSRQPTNMGNSRSAENPAVICTRRHTAYNPATSMMPPRIFVDTFRVGFAISASKSRSPCKSSPPSLAHRVWSERHQVSSFMLLPSSCMFRTVEVLQWIG